MSSCTSLTSVRGGWLTLVLCIAAFAGLVTSRPPHTINAIGGNPFENPQQADNSLDAAEIRRYFQSADDPALAGLQMQLMAQQYAANNAGSMPWEQLIRSPETKRQVRYRQCYFNPISCFKK